MRKPPGCRLCQGPGDRLPPTNGFVEKQNLRVLLEPGLLDDLARYLTALFWATIIYGEDPPDDVRAGLEQPLELSGLSTQEILSVGVRFGLENPVVLLVHGEDHREAGGVSQLGHEALAASELGRQVHQERGRSSRFEQLPFESYELIV